MNQPQQHQINPNPDLVLKLFYLLKNKIGYDLGHKAAGDADRAVRMTLELTEEGTEEYVSTAANISMQLLCSMGVIIADHYNISQREGMVAMGALFVMMADKGQISSPGS